MRAVLSALLLLSSLVLRSATAQETTGDIQGRVFGPGGQPLADVQVSVTSPSLQGDRQAQTDAHGRFVLPSLPAGSYVVILRRIGYGPVRVQDVPVRLGSTTSLGDISLQEQAVEVAEVVVSGARPVIDPVSPVSSFVIDSSRFLSLPSDRDFQSLIPFVPQANASPYPADGVNIGGSTGLENAFYVDGMNVTVSPGTSIDLPFNFVREIQVATGGYEAELGRALSGVISVVTPSGGEEFHGQVLGFYTGDQLRTAPKVGLSETDVARFTRYDLGLSLGGPLRRGRLWYFAAYNPSVARHRESVGLLPDQRDFEVQHLFAGKLTWKPRTGTDVAVTVLGDPSRRNGVEVVLPQTADPGAALSRSSTGSEAVALGVRQEMGPGTEVRVAVSRLWRHDDFFPRSGSTDLATSMRLDDYTTNASSGGPGGYSRFRETRTALRASVTLWRAAHIIKFGAEYEANTYAGVVHGGLIIRDAVNHYNWFEAFLVPQVQNRVPTLFAQDVWEVTSRLRLSAGLRWESQHISGRVGSSRTIPSELAPRLGVVLQLGEPGSARLLASAGRFYEQVPPISAIWWNGNGFYQSRDFPQNPLVDSSNGVLLQRYNVPIRASPALLGQSYDQLGIGFERRLGTGYKFGARGTYRVLRWVIEDGSVPGDTVIRLGNPGRGLLATMTRAQQRYAAFEISLERATPGPLYLLASYVLSRNVGNYTGLYATDMTFPQPNSGTQYDVDDAMINAYGLLPNDRTHVFKAAASFHMRSRLTLGGLLTLASGTPLSEGGTSIYGGGYWTFVRPRGSAGRTPAIWSLDLHGAYDLPVAPNGRVSPKLLIDVFNVGSPRRPVLYDQRHYWDASGTSVNPNYGAVTKYQPPMSARVGVVVDF